ncbi:MAG: hypothetical protein KF734_04780 [Saprospiraceae bacterium]|nr:hypothetical protein [Saprospiraceae bacterium]
MKILRNLLLIHLLCFAHSVHAQLAPNECYDIVHTRSGSEFRGQIINYAPSGDITIKTWNGLVIEIPASTVSRIVQKCKEEKRLRKDYDFKEYGLYNATRLGTLIGQTYQGYNTVGFALNHTIGWMFHRMLGAGVGLGVELFNVDYAEPATYPLFAEARGYLKAKNTTPFWAFGGGWAFAGNNSNDGWGFVENWKGGWLAKAQIGYRLGNHFTLQCGLSLQKKTRNWQSTWGGEWGQDRILHKRFELGFGILL